jgi:hypothetical protein
MLTKNQTSGKFKARVHLRGSTDEYDGQVYIQSVWDEELTPLKEGERPVSEWAEEHLGNWDLEEWLDALDLPKTGNFEALILDGRIQGSFSTATDEWDESVDYLQVLTQELPDDWMFDDEPIEITLTDVGKAALLTAIQGIPSESDVNGRCELCGGFKHYGEHGEGVCEGADLKEELKTLAEKYPHIYTLPLAKVWDLVHLEEWVAINKRLKPTYDQVCAALEDLKDEASKDKG